MYPECHQWSPPVFGDSFSIDSYFKTYFRYACNVCPLINQRKQDARLTALHLSPAFHCSSAEALSFRFLPLDVSSIPFRHTDAGKNKTSRPVIIRIQDSVFKKSISGLSELQNLYILTFRTQDWSSLYSRLSAGRRNNGRRRDECCQRTFPAMNFRNEKSTPPKGPFCQEWDYWWPILRPALIAPRAAEVKWPEDVSKPITNKRNKRLRTTKIIMILLR